MKPPKATFSIHKRASQCGAFSHEIWLHTQGKTTKKLVYAVVATFNYPTAKICATALKKGL